MWKNYQNNKSVMEKKNGHQNNEKKLFHGTSEQTLAHIEKSGFNRSYAGKNGRSFTTITLIFTIHLPSLYFEVVYIWKLYLNVFIFLLCFFLQLLHMEMELTLHSTQATLLTAHTQCLMLKDKNTCTSAESLQETTLKEWEGWLCHLQKIPTVTCTTLLWTTLMRQPFLWYFEMIMLILNI